MALEIDHLLWGTRDLEQGCAALESLFGVAPEPGGSHPAIGTRNALLSLGPRLYLEIMAPDNPASGSIGARLAELEAPGLLTWVLRSSDLSIVEQQVKRMHKGMGSLGPLKSEREAPGGVRLTWDLLFLTQHAHNGLVPFLIDWQETPHPSMTTPFAGNLSAFKIQSIRAPQLNDLYLTIGADYLASSGRQDQLTAEIQSKSGAVQLQSTPQSLTIMNM